MDREDHPVLARAMDNLWITKNSKKMKINTRSPFFLLILIVALLSSIYFLLPTAHCCDDDDTELETLTERAEAGQLDAINLLYQRAKAESVAPLEEYWALEGALQGDTNLCGAYVEIFKTRIEKERKERLLGMIAENSARPGAACLLKKLKEESSTQTKTPSVQTSASESSRR